MARAIKPRRTRVRVHRRRPYTPTIHTIHQALDMIPGDLDLDKVRAGLRGIVDDDSLWAMLKEEAVVSEARRKSGEAIAKRLLKYKFK